ncbi:MAG: peroxiredoxin, partial [Reinekea sp.]
MKVNPGDQLSAITFQTIQQKTVQLADSESAFVHLQFRRFAGCPVCNLHLRTVSNRYPEIQSLGIREVVVFHSSRAELLRYQAELPFDCIADPDKHYYRQFGVEQSRLALLHPQAIGSAMAGMFHSKKLKRDLSGGVNGVPADFLLNKRGIVLATHYGVHADDQWSVDQLLALAQQHRV